MSETSVLRESLPTLEAIEQRRSVKHYDPGFRIPHEDVEQLVASTLRAPTSFNIQNWRIVLVEDAEQRKKLREAAWNQAQITDASLVFVICGDLNAWNREPERYWRNAPAEVRDFLVGAIRNFYQEQPGLQRDEVMRSAGLAAQTLMLAAKAMGYDSCPMVGYDPVRVAELINLPPDHALAMIVVVGKALEPARPRGGDIPRDEVVFRNRFAGSQAVFD